MTISRPVPVVIAPTGEAIDGRRLLATAVGFGRALRVAGLTVDMGAAIDFARALAVIDIADRTAVHDAGAALFVRRRDEYEPYSRVFAQFWRRRGRRLGMTSTTETDANADVERDDAEAGEDDEAGEGAETTMTELAQMGLQVAGDAEEGEEVEGLTISPDAYSRGEVLRHRDFDR